MSAQSKTITARATTIGSRTKTTGQMKLKPPPLITNVNRIKAPTTPRLIPGSATKVQTTSGPVGANSPTVRTSIQKTGQRTHSGDMSPGQRARTPVSPVLKPSKEHSAKFSARTSKSVSPQRPQSAGKWKPVPKGSQAVTRVRALGQRHPPHPL